MARTVRYSIRIKLIAVTSALVMLSLGLYLVVALNLFNDDKTRYIFGSSLATAESSGQQVQSFLSRILKDSLGIYNLVADRRLGSDEERSALPAAALGVKDKVNLPLAEIDADIAASALVVAKKGGEKAPAKLRQGLAALYLRKGLAGSGDRDALQQGVDLAAVLLEESDKVDKKARLKFNADTTWDLLQAYQRLSRYEEAQEGLRAFTQEFKNDRHISEARFALAEVSYLMRDFKTAQAAYQKIVATQPEYASYAAYKQAWCDIGSGRLLEASIAFRLLLKSAARIPAPLLAAARDDLAWVEKDLKARQQPVTGPGDVTTALEGRQLLRTLFYSDPDMVEFSVYQKRGSGYERLLRLTNREHLRADEVPDNYLSRVDSERPLNFATVTPKHPVLQNSSIKGGLALLTLIREDPLTQRYLVVRFELARFLSSFQKNRIYNTYLIGSQGELFAHQQQSKLAAAATMLGEDYIRDILRSKQTTGVRAATNRAGDGLYVAYTAVGLFDLLVLSEIKTSKAFEAARELTVKSIYFGVFFIAIAMMIGMIFARTLTNPIEALFRGTEVIAGGDFKSKVTIKGNDEIGVLADSFNYMAGRIVDLLEQEKDKVRMEQEMKVAKLVQDSFFPPVHQVLSGLDIASFYTPASDCGGDWWGIVPHGDKVMLLIGDATGHGVPAALITATAASCTTTVKEFGLTHPELLDSPASVLNLLNKAVYGAAQGKILMTFFVCLIDVKNLTVTYSNASHNPPYLYQYKDKAPDKKDLKPLMEAVALRLGQRQDTVYSDESVKISPKDMILFFTDGFVECKNPAQEEYGGRKFLKSILKYAQASAEEIRDGVVGQATEFFATEPLADDLTLVVAKLLG
jgi:serine phosphatase RsbU (regulator of sigma subunit)/tetratricopeptide (TPR) repeat protein